MVVQHRFPLLLRKLDPETSISTPVPTRLFHRGSDYSHPRNLYSHARNPYSHPPGISIHIAPESVFTCPGIRTQMTHKHQRGWLKKEKRSQGETWVLFFRTVRKSDGKRVENKIPIGLLKDFSSKSCAWAEVERQHLHINQVDSRGGATFADLAHPSKSTHDNQRLRASAPQSTAATMGESDRAGPRTAVRWRNG